MVQNNLKRSLILKIIILPMKNRYRDVNNKTVFYLDNQPSEMLTKKLSWSSKEIKGYGI